YITPNGRKPAPTADLHARHAGKMAKNADGAMRTARALAGEKGLVVVAGSIFLVGEIRSKLLGLPVDPPVAL
ncbi:MAG: bifunctional folylpolyglutamate synthase/dihydrofolate synthase, partial [Polyangiaceae bacterium]